MMYQLPWGSDHRGLLIYLIDLSGSMRTNFTAADGSVTTRIDELQSIMLEVVNRIIRDNRDRINRGRSSFDVKVLAYNSGMVSELPIFDGNLLSLKQLRDKALLENKPLLELPEPNYQTATAEAFREVAKVIKAWIDSHSPYEKIPAPVVIHITDGMPYNTQTQLSESQYYEETVKAADELKSIATNDGNVLLFNIQIHGDLEPSRFLSVPPSDTKLRVLWNCSSVMDADYAARARMSLRQLETRGVNVDAIQEGSRMLVTNEPNRSILAQFIIFGSSPISEVEPEKPM